MKKINFAAAVLAVELLVTCIASAQGTTYISDLEKTAIGSGAIGSDSWIGQMFTTGTNSTGYALNSVQLLMNAASGTPNGLTASIYSSPGNGSPGSVLGSLTGSDPSSGGVFSYNSSGLILSPSTYYFVVLTATTPIAQGAYQWSACDSFGRVLIAPGDPWTIPDAYYASANGSSWTFNPRVDIFQFAITATPVPEPGVSALLALGGLSFLWRRRKAKIV